MAVSGRLRRLRRGIVAGQSGEIPDSQKDPAHRPLRDRLRYAHAMISALTRDRVRELDRWLAERPSKGRWLVVTHDNPDPDALAAALLLSKLLRQAYREKVTTAYGGLIGRAENQEMVRVLKVPLSRLRSLNFKNYGHVAMVDCQPGTGNSSVPEDLPVDLVFDHHPLRKKTTKVGFADIRIDYGATASIVAEYVLAKGLELTRREATALVYALRTETLDFSRETLGPDRELYHHFQPRADNRALGRIQYPRLSVDYFATLSLALRNLETVGTLIVSHLGPVAQPDIVPEIADLLLRMDGKTWSLCTGVHDGRVYSSLRTTNQRAHAGALMRRLLGRRGRGGGHGVLAGGWVPVAPKQDWQAVEAQLAVRLARLLRKDPEKLTRLELLPTKPHI